MIILVINLQTMTGVRFHNFHLYTQNKKGKSVIYFPNFDRLFLTSNDKSSFFPRIFLHFLSFSRLRKLRNFRSSPSILANEETNEETPLFNSILHLETETRMIFRFLIGASLR